MTEFDAGSFRMALGSFATGVTVVTTIGPDGADIGVTASSFNSVSVDPPLILWSLDKKSLSMEAFEKAEHFVVNVLSADQVDISNRFARAGEDKFSGIDVERAVGGVATLSDCSSCFQCSREYLYEGGDHVIIVGRVVNYETSGRPGLVFQAGRYAVGSDHPMMGKPSDSAKAGEFVSNFMPYLSGRLHQEFLSAFQQTISNGPLTDHQYRILFVLKDLQKSDLEAICQLTLLAPEMVEPSLTELTEQALVSIEEAQFYVTPDGLDQLSEMETRVLEREAKMMSVFTEEEAQAFKKQVGRLLEWNCQ